jgi:DNA-binding transcriptional ArsR family regulator
MFGRDLLAPPTTLTITFAVNPAVILLDSLSLLQQASQSSGFSPWIGEVAARMTPAQRGENALLLGHFYDGFYAIASRRDQSFPEFIALLEDLAPQDLVDASLTWLRLDEGFPGLGAPAAFVEFVRARYAAKGHEDFDAAGWGEAARLMQRPAALKERAIAHLQTMWDAYLAAEWDRTQLMVEESAAAFRAMNYQFNDGFEAIEVVANRNLRENEHMAAQMGQIERITFMPSPHIGPYILWRQEPNEPSVGILFGVRMPQNSPAGSTRLMRAELLMRLGALADETRLTILRMLAEEGELCAQEFITRLDLSQSSASRHLRQLSASGFISERRRDVAKCYSLNPDRLGEMVFALQTYLAGQPGPSAPK